MAINTILKARFIITLRISQTITIVNTLLINESNNLKSVLNLHRYKRCCFQFNFMRYELV